MYFLSELAPDVSRLESAAREKFERAVAGCTPRDEGVTLEANSCIFPSADRAGCLYKLTEGVVAVSYDGKHLFHYEAGDWLGFEHLESAPEVKLSTDFAVVADEYEIDALLTAVASCPEKMRSFLHALTLRQLLFLRVVSVLITEDRQYTPEILSFDPGSEIIAQGDTGREVFTLISGRAEARVDGVTVGEILEDEIFGAIAALTETPRTASVIAVKPSTALVLSGDNFRQLISARPTTVLKMIEDMAKKLVDLNSKVVELTQSRGG